MGKKDPICFCFEIYEDEIIKIIKEHNCKTVQDVQRYCQAGMGCGGCRPDIEDVIERELKKII